MVLHYSFIFSPLAAVLCAENDLLSPYGCDIMRFTFQTHRCSTARVSHLWPGGQLRSPEQYFVAPLEIKAWCLCVQRVFSLMHLRELSWASCAPSFWLNNSIWSIWHTQNKNVQFSQTSRRTETLFKFRLTSSPCRTLISQSLGPNLQMRIFKAYWESQLLPPSSQTWLSYVRGSAAKSLAARRRRK